MKFHVKLYVKILLAKSIFQNIQFVNVKKAEVYGPNDGMGENWLNKP